MRERVLQAEKTKIGGLKDVKKKTEQTGTFHFFIHCTML
jgi:hypothetical protein